MAYFLVRRVVCLLGGKHSIFFGEGCGLAFRKNTLHILW